MKQAQARSSEPHLARNASLGFSLNCNTQLKNTPPNKGVAAAERIAVVPIDCGNVGSVFPALRPSCDRAARR